MGFISRKKVVALAGVTTVAVGGVVAYAAWSASGTGSATVSATSAVSLGVADGTSTTLLFPTGSGDLKATVSNTNPYKVAVTGVTQNGSITVDSGHSTCTVSSVTFSAPDLSSSGIVLAATSGSYTITFHNEVSMDNTANDACQGATFTVPLKFTGASTASAANSPAGPF
jgi:hypothetical protein